MNATPYNIDPNLNCLTADELEHFLGRRLDSDHYTRVIRHLQLCEYCAEAVNGLERMADHSVLASLPAAWQARTGIRVPSCRKQIWRFLKPALWTGSIVLMVMWGLDLFHRDPEIMTSTLPGNREQAVPVRVAPPQGEKAAMPGQGHLVPGKSAAPGNKKVHVSTPAIGKIEKRESYVHNAESVSAPPVAINKSGTGHAVIYIHGLKVYHDPDLFAAADRLTDIQNIHLPARYESVDSKTEESAVVRIPYRKAITDALLAYRGGHELEALQVLNGIMQAVPGDLNAAFYRAMILESLGRYPSAAASFAAIAQHRNAVFGEEAFFHWALCEQSLGNVTRARKMFRQIAGNGGFYAERAKAKATKVE